MTEIRDAYAAMGAEPDPKFADRLLGQLLAELDAPGVVDEVETPVPVDLEVRPATPITVARRRRITAVLAAAAAVTVVVGVAVTRDDGTPDVQTPVTVPVTTTTAPARVFTHPQLPIGDIAAGTYESIRFTPPIALTVPDRWVSEFDRPEGIGLFDTRDENAAHLVIISTYGDDPLDEAYDLFATSISWTVTGQDTTTLGGLPAKRFRAVADGGGTLIGVDGRGAYAMDPGQLLELTMGTIDGKTVIAVATALPDRFDAFLPTAREVIASIQPA